MRDNMKRKMKFFCLFLLVLVLIAAVAACSGGDQDTPEEENGGTTTDMDDSGEEEEEGEEHLPPDPGKEAERDEEDDVDKETGEGKPDDTADGKEPQDATGPSVESDLNLERIGIYTIDEETLETKSLTAMVNIKGSLTVDNVVDAVVLALADHSIDVVVAKTTVDGTKVTVDFTSKEAHQPFGNAGSSVEDVILDCIGYSLLDNFKELTEVYFTVNGGAYESGHVYLDPSEPYLKKGNEK